MTIIDESRIPSGTPAVGGWTLLVGSVTSVDAGDGEFGWRPAQSQSLMSFTQTASTQRRLLDFILELSATPSSAREIVSFRTAAAKIFHFGCSASNKYQLVGSIPSGTNTSTPNLQLNTKHRVTVDMNEPAGTVTATIYTDDTGTEVYATLSVSVTAGTQIAAFRVGWSADPGNGALQTVSWPILANDPGDIGPRVYGGGGEEGLPARVIVGGHEWARCEVYAKEPE